MNKEHYTFIKVSNSKLIPYRIKYNKMESAIKDVSQDFIIRVFSCIEYFSCMSVYRLIASRVCIKIHDTQYTIHKEFVY